MTNNTTPTLNDIIQREYKGNTIRAVTIDGEPWFVGADALHVLAGTANGKGMWYRRLDVDEVTIVSRTNLGMNPGKPMRLVNESGLYGLILQSRKPEAREFQRWVRQDVLPAIRKDGMYVKDEEKVTSGELGEDEFIAKAMRMMEDKIGRLRQEKEALAHKSAKLGDELKRAKPKADVVDTHCARTLSIAAYARTLPGVNSIAVKRDLTRAGYLYRIAARYRVYAKYRDTHFEEKQSVYGPQLDIHVTAKGKELLTQLYRKGQLTMKQGRRVLPTV